ncbi:MAG: pyruvate dehydrogenase E2 component (dihydrolipoamide acetyltransferase), partial [Planctomycetota bacterium]
TPAATRTVPITPLRRTIAQRMVASLQQTAPVTLTTEIDATSLIEFREQLKRTGEPLVPSITDAIAKLVAIALQEHPALNARWRDDAIEIFDEVHIGIAVDTNDGLLVPVIRDAHRQSVFEIAHQSRELIEKARARRLTAHDLQGGTFTISNLGSLGIDAFTPIINFPETAVLGLGRIQTRSTITLDNSDTLARRVSEGSEVTGNLAPSLARRASIETTTHQQVMTLSLTFDHRVLDGAPAARFLQTLARLAATDSQSLFEPASHR